MLLVVGEAGMWPGTCEGWTIPALPFPAEEEIDHLGSPSPAKSTTLVDHTGANGARGGDGL